jgi:hypothetical protein
MPSLTTPMGQFMDDDEQEFTDTYRGWFILVIILLGIAVLTTFVDDLVHEQPYDNWKANPLMHEK